MKIADFGQKEIHTRIAANTAMHELYLTGGGEVPPDLSGLYSNTREAKIAVLSWQGKNRERMIKNISPTRSSKKAK